MKPSLLKLKNSLRVVLAPCEAESIAFGLFVSTGSRHEPERFAGISHFIEHMLFKGTKKRSALEITQAVEGRGGNFNAFTTEEATGYYVHMPNEYLAEAIDILTDMYLNPAINEDEFERERNVIIEEIKMYEDEPSSVASEKMQRGLFPAHPLGRPVAGSIEALSTIRPLDMQEYIRSHYTPDSTIAVLTGAFDEAEATKLIEQAFSKARGRSRSARMKRGWRSSTAPNRPPQPEVRTTKDINQAQLSIGFKTFGIHDEGKYAASVLTAILGRGMSSRLFQEVREKRGLSYDISAHIQFFEDTGILSISGGMDPARAQEAFEIIQSELRTIATTKVPEKELQRTKDYLIGNFRMSNEKVLTKMIYYGSSMLEYNRLILPSELIEKIRAVTAEAVLSAARDIIVASKRTVSWVLPKG